MPPSSAKTESRTWRHGAPMLALAALAALAGCSAPTLDEDAKIVHATLQLLATDRTPGRPAPCVDDRTRGEPLVIFRTMRFTPTDVSLRWRRPAPLQARERIGGRALFEDQIDRSRLRIPTPDSNQAVLPMPAQVALDSAARALSIGDDSDGVHITDAIGVPQIPERWWAANRLNSDCRRIIVLSRVARGRNIGFISVAADHWATIYAAQRIGADWKIIAQWETWLY